MKDMCSFDLARNGSQVLTDIDTQQIRVLEDGPWEIVDDETTGLAALYNESGTVKDVNDLLVNEVYTTKDSQEMILVRKDGAGTTTDLSTLFSSFAEGKLSIGDLCPMKVQAELSLYILKLPSPGNQQVLASN